MVFSKIKYTIEVGGIFYLINKGFYSLFSKFKDYLPTDLYSKIEFFIFVGYWPRLSNPKSLNEKITFRKLYEPHPLSNIVADKLTVREYISQKNNNNILINVLWIGTDPENIDFDSLPKSFVIKATHGSGWNLIVDDKEKINKKQVIAQCHTWLSIKYSSVSVSRETHYDDIAPKIIIEEFIKDIKYKIPLDYKFFCFHGSVEIIQVDSGRYVQHKRNLYDISWNEIPVVYNFPKGTPVEKPALLKEMIQIAEQLSSDFDFCRIDLYCQNNSKIYFGEITLTPEAGLGRFNPKKWDYILGGKWRK